jgi:hypothetical protein
MTINTLNITHINGLNTEEVIYKHSTEVVLGGNNGPNTHSGMYGVQLEPDKHILLAGIENELIINVSGTVKKIKFSTTQNTSEKCYDLLFATGRVNTENYTPIYIEADYFITLGILSPLSTYEFDVNLKINAGDQVFVGYDSGSDSDMIVFAGMDTRTSQDKSYYWSI